MKSKQSGSEPLIFLFSSDAQPMMSGYAQDAPLPPSRSYDPGYESGGTDLGNGMGDDTGFVLDPGSLLDAIIQ